MPCCGSFKKNKNKLKNNERAPGLPPETLPLEKIVTTHDFGDARSTISSIDEVGGNSPTFSHCSSADTAYKDCQPAVEDEDAALGRTSPFLSHKGKYAIFSGSWKAEQMHNGKTTSDEEADAVLKPEMRSSGLLSLFHSLSSRSMRQQYYVRTSRPQARIDSMGHAVCQGLSSWEEPDAGLFKVRGQDYMKTRLKVSSGAPIYRLLGVDVYAFDFKLNHIAQHIELPNPPVLGRGALGLPKNQQIPPFLIINMQLPVYPAGIFGAGDGPGVSFIFYFGLPDGWEPDMMNKAALGLLQRLVNDGQEEDRTPTRERLKLIPQCPDPADWIAKAPLSGAEPRLLARYNGCPVMTRPQHRFYSGLNYLEVDLDVHCYAYLARRGLHRLFPRMVSGTFDFGFVIQGNRDAELPEQILACARISGLDVSKVAKFPAIPDQTASKQ